MSTPIYPQQPILVISAKPNEQNRHCSCNWDFIENTPRIGLPDAYSIKPREINLTNLELWMLVNYLKDKDDAAQKGGNAWVTARADAFGLGEIGQRFQSLLQQDIEQYRQTAS